MSNLKQVFFVLVLSIIGGVAASVFIFPFLVRINFLNTAVILDKILKPQTITQIQKETIVIPPSDYFSEAIKKVEPIVVGIQSFSQGQLIRSGSGIILTRDGLIATANSVVPLEAAVFQVVSAEKIFKAKVVFRDYAKNIALISVAEASFPVVKLKSDLPNLGQKLLIVSKLISFGKESSFVEEALVSQINKGDGTFKISASYDNKLFGSALIDGEGAVLGIIDFKSQKPVVIFSKLVENALKDYLASLVTPKP